MTLKALNVMVVEDHGFQRRLALRLLAEIGVRQVSEAVNGAQALERLEQTGPRDVVLVDLDMPGMDGIEFIAHLAERSLARSVVVVSALDAALLHTVQTMARGYGLRVLGSVEKPLSAGKLRSVLTGFGNNVGVDVADEPVDIPPQLLRDALAAGEIGPWFQPQVEFGNGKPVAVEALARWQRPDGRVIGARDFIPMIEREGLLDPLTDLMLEESCRWKRRWARHGLRLNVSVNVAPETLADPDAADRFEQIVASHDVDPGEVVLELTESSVLADVARTLSVLARLRLKGFGLSIDDFGTGYSSLSQLSQIPFTELKIDRGFVAGADALPRKRAVIEASLELARKLELAVVAEGVETVEEWQMLAELGCGMAQGYLIARPLPGDDLPDAIGAWRRPEH